MANQSHLWTVFRDRIGSPKVFFENENGQSHDDDAITGFKAGDGCSIVGRDLYRRKNFGSVLAINDGGIW